MFFSFFFFCVCVCGCVCVSFTERQDAPGRNPFLRKSNKIRQTTERTNLRNSKINSRKNNGAVLKTMQYHDPE